MTKDHEPGAAAARDRTSTDHGGVIALAMRMLAASGPTATGATLLMPGGTSRYVSVAEARAWVAAQSEGPAQ